MKKWFTDIFGVIVGMLSILAISYIAGVGLSIGFMRTIHNQGFVIALAPISPEHPLNKRLP